jgi:D-serine deaminase-like pyridoxal phosphate-dependent protein
MVGIECFEGLIDDGDIDLTLERVDAQLDELAAVAGELIGAGLLPSEPLVSAGGSAYFDRVQACLGGLPGRLILRSGCYVTQDGGFYARVSPLAGRSSGAPVLRNALERDAPYDQGLPVPTHWRQDGVDRRMPAGAEVVALNDQHAHIRLPATCPVAAGDLMRFSVSHPCGAFDRWRAIPVLDDHDMIVDAVLTLF